MEFNKNNLKSLREDLEKALADVAKKHGIAISVGGLRFNSTECTGRLTMLANTENLIETVDPRLVKFQQDFIKNCMYLNLKKEDLGRMCKVGSEEFKIVGARARKNELVLQDKNEKLFSYPPRLITLI